MAYKITNDCINCGVCEVECPVGAIIPGGVNWRSKYDPLVMFTEAPAMKDPFYSETIYYVVPGMCNECRDFFSEPRCEMICPMGSVVKDDSVAETAGSSAGAGAPICSLFNYMKVN